VIANQAFLNQLMVVEHCFDFFRINILSGWTKDHILAPALDIDEVVFVNNSKVTGMKPSVLCEDFCSCLFVLVITKQSIVTLDLDFTYHIVWVFAINTYLHTSYYTSCRCCAGFIRWSVTDKRPAFSHSVADSNREFDLF